MSEGVPYQSLYRRFRPQRFSEVRGQPHVVRALVNAVRGGRVGHAYLFSGPRGTGKTSTARILAMALNCASPQEGEPCGTCESCSAVQAGASFDVLELDAASNNGVEAMRDLVARAALGSPGRWKVYIIDEVHMLTTASSNALLKTLEEPPSHVVFVLATTDPQKVLPTIRSRAQHFEFRLLPPELLDELVRDVSTAAGLVLDDPTVERVVRRGNGSARDALSALDQVAVAGEAFDETNAAEVVVEALCESDVGSALAGVAAACSSGRDPRRLATDLIEHLRAGFLAVMAPDLAGVTGAELNRVTDQARRLGTPALVRALEVLGEALVVMRDALDTRVTLEVALVRLCLPAADASLAALAERVDRLERATRTATSSGPPSDPPGGIATHQPAGIATHQQGARPSLGALRRRQPDPPPREAETEATIPADPVPEPTSGSGEAQASMPTRDELTLAWGDALLAALPAGSRSIYRSGRWIGVEGDVAAFALPNSWHLERAEGKRREVEEALSVHFGTRVRLRLVEDRGEVAEPPAPAEMASIAYRSPSFEHVDLDRTEFDPVDVEVSATAPAPLPLEDRLKMAFPGAEEITSP